jgi:cytoskeleton protein RodZ
MMDTQTEIQQDGECRTEERVETRATVGGLLREARLAQGLSIDDVYGRIKFAPRQIESLEAGDYASLPEGAFLRGFVRSYARMLQLDEKALIAALPGSVVMVEPAAVPEAVGVPFPTEQQRRHAMLLKVGAGAVGAVLLLSLGIWSVSFRSSPPPDMPPVPLPLSVSAPVADVVSAVVAPLALPSGVVAASGVLPVAESAPLAADAVMASPLHLVFERASWVEVKDMKGTVLLSQRNLAGTEQLLTGEAPYFLAIARINGVRLYYKGKEVDLASHADANGAARLKLE